MKVIHYSKVVNSVLSNYFLRITEANVLSSVSSVVCLHKILIFAFAISYTCTCFMQYLFIVHSIWFYQCSFVLSSKLLKHIIANQYTGVSPHYTPPPDINSYVAISKWHPIWDNVICWYPYYAVTTILL